MSLLDYLNEEQEMNELMLNNYDSLALAQKFIESFTLNKKFNPQGLNQYLNSLAAIATFHIGRKSVFTQIKTEINFFLAQPGAVIYELKALISSEKDPKNTLPIPVSFVGFVDDEHLLKYKRLEALFFFPVFGEGASLSLKDYIDLCCRDLVKSNSGIIIRPKEKSVLYISLGFRYQGLNNNQHFYRKDFTR